MINLAPYNPKIEAEFEANIIAYLVSKGINLTNFKDGSRLKTLIEAISLEAAKLNFEFKAGYDNAIRESCYQTFNFALLPGDKATGFLRYEKTGHTEDIVIPVFTVSLFGVSYISTQEETLEVGETFILISVIATESGTNYNIEAGYIDTFEGNGDFDVELDYDRIYNPTSILGGTEIESEEARDVRFKEFIGNLARCTVTGIESGLKQIPGIIESYVIENINPDTSEEEAGWVLCYISDGTANVAEELIAEAYRVVDGVKGDPNYIGYKAAGVKSRVLNVEVQQIDITYEVDVLTDSELTDEQVIAIIESAITRFVNTQKSGNNILLDQVKAYALSSHHQFYRFRILTPVSDVIVATAKLPRVGILTCNAVARVTKE